MLSSKKIEKHKQNEAATWWRDVIINVVLKKFNIVNEFACEDYKILIRHIFQTRLNLTEIRQPQFQ